jgi:hypothetical protein
MVGTVADIARGIQFIVLWVEFQSDLIPINSFAKVLVMAFENSHKICAHPLPRHRSPNFAPPPSHRHSAERLVADASIKQTINK